MLWRKKNEGNTKQISNDFYIYEPRLVKKMLGVFFISDHSNAFTGRRSLVSYLKLIFNLYIACAKSEDSGEPAHLHLCTLAWTMAFCINVRYLFYMWRLIFWWTYLKLSCSCIFKSMMLLSFVNVVTLCLSAKIDASYEHKTF